MTNSHDAVIIMKGWKNLANLIHLKSSEYNHALNNNPHLVKRKYA